MLVVFFSTLSHCTLAGISVPQPWPGLQPCLGIASIRPVMISVTPHNEVQAWMRLGDDRGGVRGLSCCCLGRSTSIYPSIHPSIHPSLQPSIVTVQHYCVLTARGKCLWHQHEHCSGSCQSMYRLCEGAERAPGLPRPGPVWASSNLSACSLSPLHHSSSERLSQQL